MHRTQGVDYVEEGGKRRYIDPNLPAVRGTVLNAESMNSIQEELCNVIEKAGLTLNSTAAADRTDGWDQLWEAITDSGIIGESALANDVTTVLNLFKYGIGIYTKLHTSTPGACWVKFAQIPIIASATKRLSGRISHLGGDFPWNSRGMDFMVEIRDSNIVCYSQSVRVFKTPGASDGSLYYKVNGENLELWAYTTASYPRLVLTPNSDCLQYFNPSAEFTDTAPGGTTAFTEIQAESELYVPKPTSGTITVTESTHESQFVATPANGDTIVFPNTHACWAQLSTSSAVGTIAYLCPKPTDLVDGDPYVASVSFLDTDGECVRATIREDTGDFHYSAMTVVRKGSGWQVLSGGIQASIMSTL